MVVKTPTILLWHEDRNPAPLHTLLAQLFNHGTGFTFPSAVFKGLRSGNNWRSRKAQNEPAVVLLRKTIADHLCIGGGLVLFHFDGDEPWSKRADSSTLGQFEDRILRPVMSILASRGMSEDDVRSRFRTIVPYYSLESWLFRNTARAREICTNRCARSTHALHEIVWRKIDDEASYLDEITKPKEHFCLGDRFNAELAERFPWDSALASRTSFFDFIQLLAGTAPFRAVIRRDILTAIANHEERRD
jgi:hypothetical protein